MPAVQSIASVVVAFNSIVNGSGSFIVTVPKFNSTGFPEASKQSPLSLILTE